jgi:ribulose-phosphate 3-epimerase
MGSRPVIISPSLLASDFGRLAEEVQQIQDAGADWLHVDVMDGHFVPNLTIGPVVVEAVRRVSRIPLDVHLMINHPEQYIKPFMDAGAQYLTVHVEAPGLRHEGVLLSTLESIRTLGGQAGLSVRPRTTAESMKPYLEALDLVLVMSVEPGLGGQAFMPEVVPKVRQLRQWFAGHLAVDGGINVETGRQMRQAGANVLVAGTYLFRSGSYREAIQALRDAG